MKNRNSVKGIVAVSFAVGLVISCFCPPEFLIAILSIAVIILGLSAAKC